MFRIKREVNVILNRMWARFNVKISISAEELEIYDGIQKQKQMLMLMLKQKSFKLCNVEGHLFIQPWFIQQPIFSKPRTHVPARKYPLFQLLFMFRIYSQLLS